MSKKTLGEAYTGGKQIPGEIDLILSQHLKALSKKGLSQDFVLLVTESIKETFQRRPHGTRQGWHNTLDYSQSRAAHPRDDRKRHVRIHSKLLSFENVYKFTKQRPPFLLMEPFCWLLGEVPSKSTLCGVHKYRQLNCGCSGVLGAWVRCSQGDGITW